MRVFKHTLIGLVLACYLVVAIAGHVAILAKVVNSHGPSTHITTEGKTIPIESKPVWTQRKHIPTVIKLDVPDAGLVCEPPPLAEENSCILIAPQPRGDILLEIFHPFSPRDPPFS